VTDAPRRRRRDRHGRGPRGPLAPASVPLVETAAERFDAIVLDAIDGLDRKWRERLRTVEFEVQDVPPVDDAGAFDDEIESTGVPLARLVSGSGDQPPRIVLYRRPIELRALDQEDLEDLVHDVVVEEVAHFLGLDPGRIDPDYDE
jgi:predicted Zn-dependent protease with MMP-like domain